MYNVHDNNEKQFCIYIYFTSIFKMIFDIIHPSSFNVIINSKCKEASKMSNNKLDYTHYIQS